MTNDINNQQPDRPENYFHGHQDDDGDWHDIDFPKKLTEFEIEQIARWQENNDQCQSMAQALELYTKGNP